MFEKATSGTIVDSSADRNILALYLDNALLKHRETAFQNFFVQAAIVLWGPDFEPRKAQGSLGDKKCDGYRISDNAVFQCYGPAKMVASVTCIKIDNDFNGARKHFGDGMKKWIFVHTEEKGLPTEAHEFVIGLRDSYPDIHIETWSPGHLRTLLLELTNEKLRALFPNAPSSRVLRKVPYNELDEVIQELQSIEPEPTLETPIAPSPEKIQHNKLSAPIVSYLQQASLAAGRVERYFSETSRSKTGERIAEFLKREYAKRTGNEETPQQIFHGIIDLAGGLDVSQERASAVLGLVAYFFHTCDIFEDVPS